MRKYSSVLALVLLTATSSFAQLGFGDTSPKATIEGSLHKRDGDNVEGTVTAKIAEGWHVNSNKPTEDFAIPTALTLDADWVEASFPPHAMKAFQFTGGKTLPVFDGTFSIPFRAKLRPGATTLTAKLRYQACSDRVCLAPNEATAQIDLAKITAAPVVTATGASPDASAGGGSGAFTPLSAAPKDAQKSSLLSSDVGGTFAARGLPLTLLAIFILGLALNLTPCVYPLIPITIGYFSQQSGSSKGRRVALSTLYVLGIAITYSALGVFSALSGKLFGAWLQHPGVLVFFAALMLIMASSMFGAFELRVPQFISNRSGGQSGLGGALTMGLVIGIVAAPCVGPFVISLIALVSSLQDPFLGFLMFFVLALGLGLPYLFLGIFSSSASALPRSGMWMVQVKRAMGFILIAMAFYFLRPLIGDLAFQYGVAGSLLVGAAFLFFFSRSQGATVWRIAIAMLLLVSGVAFAIPRSHGDGVQWAKYDAKALADARAAGKPVVIDFYADWCLPCKELDEKTFSDPKVVAELDRFVRVKADLTVPSDEKTKALTKQYGIVGVPTIVFLDSNGAEVEDVRLFGFKPADEFLQHAQAVK
ncbi:MAG TPA: cytochrome c biogenesis protein CcdA [Thermoanaerobaculia bacterium]|nr:cytochrome c biogenesis protein CcdA [Thermoanaerobaculia bacterium]